MASVRALACLLLLVAVAFTSATASDEKSEHVVSLGADFDATVNDGNVWFIKVRDCRCMKPLRTVGVVVWPDQLTPPALLMFGAVLRSLVR